MRLPHDCQKLADKDDTEDECECECEHEHEYEHECKYEHEKIASHGHFSALSDLILEKKLLSFEDAIAVVEL